jgi:glycerophosphoryl diester phosphodiesterase
VVTRRFLEAAHSRGVRVDVWTINDPGEMRRMLDLGVGGVITDIPEELTGVLGEREGS